MILVPSSLYREHVKQAKQEFWPGVLPQWDSLPGRIVLCAKHAGKREWSLWSIGPIGWWRPRLPEVLRSLDEKRIDYRCMPHPALSLREAWVVGDHLGPGNMLCAAAVGPELRRVWFHAIDGEPDGLEPGVNRRTINPGRPTSKYTPDRKQLVLPWEGGISAPLYSIAQSEHTRLKGLKK